MSRVDTTAPDARPVTARPTPTVPGPLRRPLLVFGYHLRILRRTWQGSAFVTLGGPVLFLAALGLGLGTLVDGGQAADLAGASYPAFAATGLLAATAMQTAASECAWPVRGAVQTTQTYAAMLATPLRSIDVVVGQLLAVALRLLLAAIAFAVAMVLFDVAPLWASLAGVPLAVLVGVAHGAPVMAVAVRATRDDQLPLVFRFGVMPLFLLSGTFFPIDRLPDVLRPLAWCSPLWHGVEATRAAVLGSTTPAPLTVHLGVLVVVLVAGTVAASRAVDARLRS